MKFNHSSHILLELDEQNSLSLRIDDAELFDFIDDYLTETCNLTYAHCEISEDTYKYEIILDNYKFEEIKNALSKINLDEIEGIYKLNNKL